MLIRATTGNENFPSGTSKFHLFFTPTRQRMGREVPIQMLAKGQNPDAPVTVSQKTYFSAMSGYPETLGMWNTATYDVPEGVVLKLFAHRKQTMQRQQLPALTAGLFLQLRSGAALRRISCNTLQDPKGSLAAVTFEGRFDVLTPTQMAQLGIPLNPAIMGLLDGRKQQRMFDILVLDREVAGRVEVKTQKIQNSEGKVVAVQKQVTKRAVKL